MVNSGSLLTLKDLNTARWIKTGVAQPQLSRGSKTGKDENPKDGLKSQDYPILKYMLLIVSVIYWLCDLG